MGSKLKRNLFHIELYSHRIIYVFCLDILDLLGIVLYVGVLRTLRLPSSSGETREVPVSELIITYWRLFSFY